MVEAARSYVPPDALTLFIEDDTLAATGYVQEDGADKVITIGPGRLDAILVIDVASIEIASNDEKYIWRLVGSNDDFTALQVLAEIEMGATEVRALGAIDSVAGRYLLPFANEIGGVEYNDVKLHCTISGAIATGIVYSAWITIPRG